MEWVCQVWVLHHLYLKQKNDNKKLKNIEKTKKLNENLIDIELHKRTKVSTLLNDNKNNDTKIRRENGNELFKIGLKLLPNTQEYRQHYYDRVINAELHPLIERFMELHLDRIIERYCHLNPNINPKSLKEFLSYKPKYFAWVGSDLFVTTTPKGIRQLCIIETNSCPSGQKSMPNTSNNMENLIGYTRLMENTFKPGYQEHLKNNPELSDDKYKFAVIYDKNSIEAFGYAHAMSNVMNEEVIVAKYYNNDGNPPVKFDENGLMWIRVLKDSNDKNGYFADNIECCKLNELSKKEKIISENINEDECEWVPIKAAFRYVTQNPWDRIPLITKTMITNPIVCCLAGGRNKNLANKAYDLLNREIMTKKGLINLKINVPDTINDVDFNDIPLWVKRFGNVAVVKSPYGNAGVDVHTICNEDELNKFMAGQDGGRSYGNKYIVQALIGNDQWSSLTPNGRLYHVGTVPDMRLKSYAADLRMMIQYDYNNNKWIPLCMYSRRAREPLIKDINKYYENTGKTSWDMLGTNLSVNLGSDNLWGTDVDRLVLMDTKDFNTLGIGIDDVIQAYVQTVMSAIAIDKMCQYLVNTNDDGTIQFDIDCFDNLNRDAVLHDDIINANQEKHIYTDDEN